jgi:serine protein kinase
MDAASFLQQTSNAIQKQFREKRQILSAEEFFSLLVASPGVHMRGAAQYLKDCFDFYKTREIKTPTGKENRFRLFDMPFDQGEYRLAGQEKIQNDVYRALENFVRQGRVDRLILLHGPNGSAKSTFISCLIRALEHYSEQEEGALYRFQWIFPSEKIRKGQIGFSEAEKSAFGDPSKSYAYLPEDQIDARIPSEMRDHPLLLLPQIQREQMIEAALKNAPPNFVVPQVLRKGELEQRSRMIFDALLNAYRGDFQMVLRHVQVERFYVSRRYRTAAVTVEPQMSVDARSRQLTIERSLQALPPTLQNIAFYDLSGELVDANRGILEYNDLLKRPMETFKYLLSTCENGRVSLEHTILFLDLMLIGSANDKYLNAFRESPDWPSFRGRLELIRVPYLLNYKQEQEVYDAQLKPEGIRKHIAPHTTMIAALWAVLTRLKPPLAENYPKNLRDIVAELNPLEKAELYARGRIPSKLDTEENKLMSANIKTIFKEFEQTPDYEGLRGASVREVKTVLLNAVQDQNYACVSPLAVAEELRRLMKEGSTYEFLQRRATNGYFDHEGFLEITLNRYLDLSDLEMRTSLGFVEEGQYRELFARYVTQVSHWAKGEKPLNPITNTYEAPNAKLMAEVEKTIGVEADRDNFRKGLISKIGAWSLENLGKPVDYQALFPQHLERLEKEFFEQHKKQLKRGLRAVLSIVAQEPEPDAALRAQAEAAVARLQKEYGYCEHCIKETAAYLLRKRYP